MLLFHTLFLLFPVQVPFWRYRWRCASRATFFSPLSSELCIEVIHPFCIDKARKRGCIEHPRVVNHNFRNALTLHYNFGGYFTSSSNLFYEQWIYCFSTHSHRGFKPAQFECILRAMQCVHSALCAKVEMADFNTCGRTTASQLYLPVPYYVD